MGLSSEPVRPVTGLHLARASKPAREHAGKGLGGRDGSAVDRGESWRRRLAISCIMNARRDADERIGRRQMKGELHDSLESILPEWEELFRSDPEATPFMSPEWARAWWPSWGSSSRPWTVVVRDSGRLVGLAPFILRRRGPLRILGRPGSHPSQDVLATSELRPAVAEAVVREIVKRRREWDLLAISWFPETSSIQPSMKQAGTAPAGAPYGHLPLARASFQLRRVSGMASAQAQKGPQAPPSPSRRR